MMNIPDFTSSGYVYCWGLVAGQARCIADAIPSTDAGALLVLQRNAAIRAALPPVIEFEAARAIVARGEPDNGEPPRIQATGEEGEPLFDESGQPIMIDNSAWALLPEGDDGRASYEAAIALIAGASLETQAFALWRQPEPAEGEDGRSAWLDAKQLVEAAIDAAAQVPPETDPRPVPERVELWQAKGVLASMGLLEQADAIIDAAGPVVKLFWQNARVIHRDAPTLAQLSEHMPLSAAQLDDMFRQAAALDL